MTGNTEASTHEQTTLNVPAEEFENTTLTFDNPTDSARVATDDTSPTALETGDVVVIDIGNRTGPNSRHRSQNFNKTAYRYTGVENMKHVFVPSDGRATTLEIKRGEYLRGSSSLEAWADTRVSADALIYPVLDE